MPIFATTEININEFDLKRIPANSIPYVLKYGNPVIDILRYGDKEKYNYFLKLGRIETREDQFGEIITDEQKKQIIKKSAEYKLSEKTLDPTYKKDIENILDNVNNFELEEFIESLKGFSGTPKKPKPTNIPEPIDKNAIKLETKEFLQKALNLQDDAKFSVYINKNNQNLRNYLENIFNNNKQEFVEEIKKNISLPEEEKVQIEKLNELDLDQFIEGFVRIMGIAFVYKIIPPLSTYSYEELMEKLNESHSNIKKTTTILRNLNEDYLVKYFIELSIDKIKELSEASEARDAWKSHEKYKDHTIEQLKNSLEKIDNVRELLNEVMVILAHISLVPRS